MRESVINRRLLSEGEAKGIVRGKLEVAQNSLQLGMTPQMVV